MTPFPRLLAASTTLVVLALCHAPLLRAQGPDVSSYVRQVANGWTADAKKALPDLLIDHPNDAGVLYLHASLVEDPSRAMPLFERIVDAFPKSEWADDAMLRIVMYAAVRRDTTKARKALATFRDQFATSDLLTAAADVVRMTVGLPLPTERTKPATAAAAKPATAAAEPATTTEQASAKPFSVQVGSYSDKTQAEAMAETFRKKRLVAKVTTKKVGARTGYAIMVGEYATDGLAQKDVPTVRAICKCKAFVVHR